MTPKARRKAATHPFAPDPDLGADIDGRKVCRACHLLGTPDDARHHLPDPPDDVQRLAAGERGDG